MCVSGVLCVVCFVCVVCCVVCCVWCDVCVCVCGDVRVFLCVHHQRTKKTHTYQVYYSTLIITFISLHCPLQITLLRVMLPASPSPMHQKGRKEAGHLHIFSELNGW